MSGFSPLAKLRLYPLTILGIEEDQTVFFSLEGNFCNLILPLLIGFMNQMGVNPKIGGNALKWMVKIRENPMKKWMIWGGFSHRTFFVGLKNGLHNGPKGGEQLFFFSQGCRPEKKNINSSSISEILDIRYLLPVSFFLP